ncbi:low-density lipoprotein receptor-related protein-like [Rhynchophorus ferrugineus]|uniref:low-density lipoprotein receptor-related protein-like n=1 Tax=Rhynchophorus ferrugineus TaxID=354439 RepID=UPI003FCDD6D9
MLLLACGILLLLGVPQEVSSGAACRISEFPCRNGKCVRLNGYCDGKDDCGDMSDEPMYCTVCNRTYYGDVGKTYDLRVVKAIDARLPFLCHLTFTANGQSHGDIVQVITVPIRVELKNFPRLRV